MAYDICIWVCSKDGKSEEQIKAIRIKRVEEIPEIVRYWEDIPDVVRITKERSEGSITFTTLWIKEGYVDPF